MNIIKYNECGEFWGARYCEPVVELEIDRDEVYELVLEEIENGWDMVYHTLDVDYDDYEFEIDPYDYLTEEDIEELESFIEAE